MLLIRRSYIFLLLVLHLQLWAQPLSFVENQGQWQGAFDYHLSVANVDVYLEGSSLTINLADPHDLERRHEAWHNEAAGEADVSVRRHMYKVRFVGASGEVTGRGLHKREPYFNYLLGKDPSRWRSRVPLFGEVVYENLYPGIDLRYQFSDEGNLKYDLVIKPNASPDEVALHYEGAEDLVLEGGELIVKTSVGEVRESAPVAYQLKDGRKKLVECAYVLEGDRLLFSLGDYDRSQKLVIDPQLVFSTYSGSTADNYGFTATYSEDGGLYGGGIVFFDGGAYPTTTGAFIETAPGGSADIGISKYTADGSSLVYSTYLGGSSGEMPYSMYESKDKALVIMGSTGSADFPVTANAHDTVFVGGSGVTVLSGRVVYSNGCDLFFTILDSTGANLVGSTYFGDSANDGLNFGLDFNYGDPFRGEVIADADGNIYGAASTFSTGLATSSAFMTTYGGSQDGIVCRFNDDLSQLDWASYIGGANADNALTLKVGPNNDLYVAGGTRNQDLPFGTNGELPQGPGAEDGYIARLDKDDGSFISGTYNGTSARDVNYFLDVDFTGSVYVTGQTRGLYSLKGDSVYHNGNSAQFIHKMSADLGNTEKSTTIGDGNHLRSSISPTAFMVDDCQNVFLSGWGGNVQNAGGYNQGNTHGLPVTANAYQATTDGSDFYFAVLDASWQKLTYATFFGGTADEHVDGGTSRFAKDGTIYQAVCAGCDERSFPTTSGTYSPANPSYNCNLGSIKMALETDEVIAEAAVDVDSSCIPYIAHVTNRSYNADVFLWKLPNGQEVSGESLPPISVDEEGPQHYRLIATDTTCGFVDSTDFTLHGIKDSVVADFSTDYDGCRDDLQVRFINQSVGADSIYWQFGDGDSTAVSSPVHQYDESGNYQVRLFVYNDFCNSSDTVTQTVQVRGQISSKRIWVDYDPCEDGSEVSFTADGTGFQEYLWSFGDGGGETGRSVTHHFANAGVYAVALELNDTLCDRYLTNDTVVAVQDPSGFDPETMANVFTPNGDGTNDYFGPPIELAQEYITDFSLRIYNRWGRQLYVTESADRPWNGKFEGNDVPQGVYYYLLSYTDQCGNSGDYKGFVHLSR